MLARSSSASYISQRGLQHGLKPFLRYVPILMKALPDLFHPVTNPEGYIVTTLSENTQMIEEMMLKLASLPHIPFSKLQLGDFNGSPELKDGIRKLVMREISSNILLHDNDICCLNATACMTSASCALFNPGEALLILTPCYPAFFNDFSVPGDVHCVSVQLDHPNYFLDIGKLEAAYIKSVEDGHPPRAIIVTNPSNPTGLCYSKDELTALLRWVREKHLFYISSEVYGTVCHATAGEGGFTGNPFVSIIDIAYEEAKRGDKPIDLSKVLGDDIQIIWSASKDLGLSGLRVGASICQNPLVHAAMSPYGMPTQISRHAQYTVAHLLNDEEWISDFFKTMRFKLHNASTSTESTLTRLNIPFVKPYGGLFIWLDLAEFLPLYYYKRLTASASPGGTSTAVSDAEEQSSQPTEQELSEAEWDMFEEIFISYRLGLTPGIDFVPPKRSVVVPKPFSLTGPVTWNTSAGFMRCCFASVPLPFIGLAMQRIEKFILEKRREIEDLSSTKPL